MPDRLFDDSDLAALYDLFAPSDRRGDFAFYLPLIMSVDSVLDVGCGTGALLHLAREQGHTGRLYGIDPARGMIEQARRHAGIEWVLGDLASITLEGEFDLVVMSGHAFQVFVEDDVMRTALATIGTMLKENGRFAFETRNPLLRAWEQWETEYAGEVTDSTGAVVRVEVDVEQPSPDENGIVRFSHTFTNSGWSQPRVSCSTLRFIDVRPLSSLLNDTGFIIEQQFGDWDGSPLSDTSPEIITVAKRA